MNLAKSFYELTPDHVLEAAERAGYAVTGRYNQLNSYENRVFDLWLEPEGRIIVKLYRPERWSRDAILEEHRFLQELRDGGLSAIAPITLKNGSTILDFHGLYVTFFPKQMGRMPQELNAPELKQVGRLLAQLHNIGEQSKCKHRLTLNTDSYGWPALNELKNWCSPEIWPRYQRACEKIFDFLEEEMASVPLQRIHGDLHRGNLLLLDKPGLDAKPEFFLVDFDDFCVGPVAQDFWMLLPGKTEDTRTELSSIIEGYEELREFDDLQVSLFEGLRGLRIIHYGAWIARRWEDPTFPQLFPQFRDYVYWAEETEALERIAWGLT